MYVTAKIISLLRRAPRASLATQTATGTSLLFLAAILAVGVTSLQSFRAQLTSVMIAEQSKLVRRIADDVDQKVVALQRVLILSALEIGDDDLASSDAAQRYLDRNTTLYGAIDRSLVLYSDKGILLAERPSRPNRRGDDASWRPYIRDTINRHQPVISEPFLSKVGDSSMVLALTMPIFAKDGSFIGILSGSLDLTKPGMLGNFATTVLGKTGYLFIAAADGELIMHPDHKRLSQPTFSPHANALFERALKGFEGTEMSVDADGHPVLASYYRVPSSGWIVAAVYPAAEAFLPIDDLIRRFVELVAIACVLVVVAVWVLTHYLMRPLVSLTEHLKDYKATRGMIAPLAGRRGSGEIRDLTSAFNRLAARLHDREDALIETMQSFQVITENSADLITKHSPSGIVSYASPVSLGMLGIEGDALLGHSWFEQVHPQDFHVVHRAFDEACEGKSRPTIMFRMRRADQGYVWLESTLRLINNTSDETTPEVLCISRNISDRKQMEESLHDLARTDHLTSLPNRFLLEERFAEAVTQARREGSLVALLMIDIDRFKNINDTLGHGMGDALLKLAAAKLKSCTRDGDTLARWGGDEFVLLLPSLQDAATAVNIAQRCIAALKQPFDIDGRTLHATGAIGICTSGSASADAESMLRDADTAMYKAKARGGDCLVMYSSEMSVGKHSRLSMENDLFQSIDRGELLLHYQPLISSRTGRLAGAEALIRWQRPDQGLVLPGEFIPIAEETGFIDAIGEWVLHTACTQMDLWYRDGLARIPISLNVSSRQFRQDRLAATIRHVLEHTRFDPQLLELELTESLVMDDVERSRKILGELKSLGVSIALDDFGTGYSSLSYLKGFQLDTLKIDRTFTAELTTSEASASIVRATIGLAKGLRLRTIAEGVETKAQANYLAKHGCDVLQGYLFARPMEPEAFMSFASASPIYLLARPAHENAEVTG